MNAEGGGAGGIVGENVGDEIGRVAGEGIGTRGLLIGEKSRGEVFAETGQGGVGVGEFKKIDFGISDGEAESVFGGLTVEGGQVELGEETMQRFRAADLIEHAHGRDVE